MEGPKRAFRDARLFRQGERERVRLRHRQQIYAALETARRALCPYSRDPCDCKYGIQKGGRAGSERTGCPELRDLIREWTEVAPYNYGQSVQDDLDTIEADALAFQAVE